MVVGMQRGRRVLAHTLAVLAVLAVVAPAVLMLAGGSAGAADAEIGGANGVDQSDFQMPFPCGEVWGASTYADHPAVDWNGVGLAAGSADQGKPVVAALGGTVLAAGDQSGYGGRVIIDHGDGWSTMYAHLSALWVAPGQRVAMGTLVGSIGNTGASGGPHLHWEQRYLGRTVPLLWAGGAPIDTTYGSPGPTYVSANCPENAYGVSLVPSSTRLERTTDRPPSLSKRSIACTPAGCGGI